MQAHSRYDVLDGLRGIAALCVMFYHVTLIYDRPLFPQAGLAVDFFFALSGFVILHSYGTRLQTDLSPARYLRLRLIRLYPMFALSLVVALCAYLLASAVPEGLATTTAMIKSFFINMAMLPYQAGWGEAQTYPVFPLNKPLWSLFFEMIASIAFLILCRFTKAELLALCALCYTILLAWAFWCFRQQGYFEMQVGWSTRDLGMGFARVFCSFSLGMVIYRLMPVVRATRLPSILQKIPYASFGLYAAFIILMSLHVEMKGLVKLAALVTVLPACLIAGALLPVPRPSEQATARFLGWLSYPVYCLHIPLFVLEKYMLERHFGLSFESPAVLCGAAIVAILLTCFLARYIDDPVRRWLAARNRA